MKIFLGGIEYPVEYTIYKYQEFDLETEDYADVYKMRLKNYGECDIFFKHKMEELESDADEEPVKSFADMALEKTSE